MTAIEAFASIFLSFVFMGIGYAIQEIQKLLGHTNLDTTRRYTDTKIEQVQASYRQYIA